MWNLPLLILPIKGIKNWGVCKGYLTLQNPLKLLSPPASKKKKKKIQTGLINHPHLLPLHPATKLIFLSLSMISFHCELANKMPRILFVYQRENEEWKWFKSLRKNCSLSFIFYTKLCCLKVSPCLMNYTEVKVIRNKKGVGTWKDSKNEKKHLADNHMQSLYLQIINSLRHGSIFLFHDLPGKKKKSIHHVQRF